MRKVTPERAVTDFVIPLGRAGGREGERGRGEGGKGEGRRGRGAGKGGEEGGRGLSRGGKISRWAKLSRGGRDHAQGSP